MNSEIVVGRTTSEVDEIGLKYAGVIGRVYDQEGNLTSTRVLLDFNRPHLVLILGKTRQGKSYSMGVIAEELFKLNDQLQKKVAAIIVDNMGIFHTMKYDNVRESETALLLEKYGTQPRGFDVKVFAPKEVSDSSYVYADAPLCVKPSELSATDWAGVFEVDLNKPMGLLLYRVISSLKKDFGPAYDIPDILQRIEDDQRAGIETKEALSNRIATSVEWGIFDSRTSIISDLIHPGAFSVLDVSTFDYTPTGWSVRSLIVGLIARRIMRARMHERKKEELRTLGKEIPEEEFDRIPMVWLMIDEAHMFLPRAASTCATSPLLEWITQGQQPGLSLFLATQRPGRLHDTAISQCDIVISHRLTAKPDVDALNVIMQTYLSQEIGKYIDSLPKLRGSAIILDDNLERIERIRVRPRQSHHGGKEATLTS